MGSQKKRQFLKARVILTPANSLSIIGPQENLGIKSKFTKTSFWGYIFHVIFICRE